MSWTDERIATLKKLWEGGSTASQIAEELGGVSRNAVIGKEHRLGLKSRPSPVKANDKKKAAKKAAPKAPATKKAAPKAAPKPAAKAPVAKAADTPAPKPAPDGNSQPMPNPISLDRLKPFEKQQRLHQPMASRIALEDCHQIRSSRLAQCRIGSIGIL